MFRKNLMLIVTLCLFLALCSCSFPIQGEGDLKYIKVDDSEYKVLSYNGDLYYQIEAPYLDLWTTPEDVEIGRQHSIMGENIFYVYESDRPLYIWISQNEIDYALDLYMRRDFLYREEAYVLAGTDTEVYFFREIQKVGYDVPTDNWISSSDHMVLYLAVDDRVTEDEKRLAIDLPIIHANDGNYYIFNDGPWLLSENLVAVLKENGMIRG